MRGSRAVWLAIGLVLVAALLAYALHDGSIFKDISITSLLGKFGYDGARDVSANMTGSADAPASTAEEYGD